MSATLELIFSFSACFDDIGGHLEAHNYTLRLVTAPLERAEECRIRREVDRELISKIASRDLGHDVDFLKNKPLTEWFVLSEFQQKVSLLIAPHPVYRLSLERADGTRLNWFLDAQT